MVGAPTIAVGGHDYPLFFSVLGIEEWAEAHEWSFEVAITSGWSFTKLTKPELRQIVTIALRGGEARRHACEGGQALTIDAGLVDTLLSLYHMNEVAAALYEAWLRAPGEPDPQRPALEPAENSPSASSTALPIA